MWQQHWRLWKTRRKMKISANMTPIHLVTETIHGVGEMNPVK